MDDAQLSPVWIPTSTAMHMLHASSSTSTTTSSSTSSIATTATSGSGDLWYVRFSGPPLPYHVTAPPFEPAWRVHTFRHEWLRTLPDPLSADAFLACTRACMDADANDAAATAAAHALLMDGIGPLARELDASLGAPVEGWDVCALLHAQGIPLRRLGLLATLIRTCS